MAITGRPTVLFVCPDNGGVSLLAEALTLHAYTDLRPFSAAAGVPGPVDPAVLECLAAARIPADGLSAKPAGMFGLAGAPRLDLVVALGAGAGRAVRRQPWVGGPRMEARHVETWALPEAPPAADQPGRRGFYRTLLPQLAAAIGGLEERFTLSGAAA